MTRSVAGRTRGGITGIRQERLSYEQYKGCGNEELEYFAWLLS